MARFNYTGRRTISRKHVEITLTAFESGGRKQLKIDGSLDLSSYRFDASAPVYLEVYSNDFFQTRRFGSAENPRASGPCSIDFPPEVFDLKVRVKVLSPEPGSARVVGIVKGFAPSIGNVEGSARRRSLIAVRSMDLEGEIWKLEMQDDPDQAPVLNIERSLGDHLSLFNTPWFAASIMAQVLKEVLVRILIIENGYEEDEDTNWSKWVGFARQFSPDRKNPPSENEVGKETYASEALGWIEEVVKRFSRDQKYLEAFRSHLEEMRT